MGLNMKKVFIGPNSNLSLPDFAQIYGGEGASPEEAASNIHLNFPTEAQSVLSRSWKNLGIPQSPEQYFASVAKAPALTASAPQVVAPSPSAWPVFTNEVDRNIAIDSGAVDYRYPSPLQKQRATALDQISALKAAEFKKAQVAQAPSPFSTDPDELYRSQTAGDDGIARKILFNLEARRLGKPDAKYEDWLATHSDATPAVNIPAYIPRAGVGNLGNTGTPTRLDTNIYFDTDFQKTLQRDPEKASFIYERLTGRGLNADIGEHQALRKQQLTIGRDYAAKALKEGATYDPQTQQWQVWNTDEAPEGGVSALTGVARPYHQHTIATPDQARMLNEHYEAITNQKLPVRDELMEDIQRPMKELNLQQLQSSPEFQAKIKEAQTAVGRTLNSKEYNLLASAFKDQQTHETETGMNRPLNRKVLDSASRALHSLMGVNPDSPKEQRLPADWVFGVNKKLEELQKDTPAKSVLDTPSKIQGQIPYEVLKAKGMTQPLPAIDPYNELDTPEIKNHELRNWLRLLGLDKPVDPYNEL